MPAWRQRSRRRARSLLRRLAVAVILFQREHGLLLAAAVAFYFLLSLGPLAALAVSVFGFVLGGDAGARQEVQRFLESYIAEPQQETARMLVDAVISERGAIGIGALAALAVTATAGFSTLETAINLLWHAPARRFLPNKLFGLLMVGVVGALLFTSLLVAASAQLALASPWLPAVGAARVAVSRFLAGSTLSVLIATVGFAAIYRLFPTYRPSRGHRALLAGAATALAWEVAKQLYAAYSTRAGAAGATHGALTGMVGLVMWVYVSAALTLFGAKVAWVLEGCPRYRPERVRRPRIVAVQNRGPAGTGR
jgi:membrane protein